MNFDASGNAKVPEKIQKAFNEQLLPLQSAVSDVLQSNLTPEQKKQKQDAIRKGLVGFLEQITDQNHPHLEILKSVLQGATSIPPMRHPFQPPR